MSDSVKNRLAFALGLAAAALWLAFCVNSEIDRSGGLVLSRFFIGKAIHVLVFLGIGFVSVIVVLGLLGGMVKEIDSKTKGAPAVIIGLVMFSVIILMITGAFAVLTSSGSNPHTPGTIYYYYYY